MSWINMTITSGFRLALVLDAVLLTSCGSSSSSPPASATTSAPTGTTVQVSVQATDNEGDQLHYRWAATEGTITNVDAPKTTWVVPVGSGLQFVYVLVSDNKGGYTERRAAALTFGSTPPGAPFDFKPAATSPATVGFAWGTLFYSRTGASRRVYLPGVTIAGTDSNGSGFSATTDLKGEFFIPNLAPGTYPATYTLPGGISGSFNITVALNSLPTSPSSSGYISVPVPGGALRLSGHISLGDRSLCGIRNEFFTHSTEPNLIPGPQSATVELLDAANNSLAGPVAVNHYGDFLLTRGPITSSTVHLRVRCEQAPVQIVTQNGVPLSGDFVVPSLTINALSTPATPNTRPVIHNVTVSIGGRDVSRPDLPKPRTLLEEMDLAPGDDAFLTYKGIDTRKSACAYYNKIGAVEHCDENGFPTGGQLTLDQWQRKFNLSPFHDGNAAEPEFKAIYINKQDLNLTRDMQAIKLQDGTLAYNVCNYPGPQDVNDPLGSPKLIGEETQPDINLAIDNAKRGIGKVVCVAMDYNPSTGVRFYTFSPSGRLLLSVSLDGRREKFMPGACVACHGGDNYGGKFPDDYSLAHPTGTGNANLGSYFLPFDVANFYFSNSDPSLSRNSLLLPLRRMNELLAAAPGNPIVDDLRTLITTRWYPDQTTNEQQKAAPAVYEFGGQSSSGHSINCTSCHTLSVPAYDARLIHKVALAPICQICHTSNSVVREPQNGDSPRITFLERPPAHYLKNTSPAPVICGGGANLKTNHAMPNALGSFERFWLKKQIDQPAWLFSFPPTSTIAVNSLNGTPPFEPTTGPQGGACSSLLSSPAL